MIIFYSGARSKDVAPEDLLRDKKEAGFMLTYGDFYKKRRSDTIRRFKKHKTRMKKYGKGKS